MNRILFFENEIDSPLLRTDHRYFHIKRILKLEKGDSFKAGIINKVSGLAVIDAVDKDKLAFTFFPDEDYSSSVLPVIPVIGACRPPVAKRLLKDLASMSVERIIFIASELTDKSYLESKMWKEGNYKSSLIEGASQGAVVRLPELVLYKSLSSFLNKEGDVLLGSEKIVLDNKPVFPVLRRERTNIPTEKTYLAIGPERGWSDRERNFFHDYGFSPVTLSSAILRTEVAVHGAIILQMERMGLVQF